MQPSDTSMNSTPANQSTLDESHLESQLPTNPPKEPSQPEKVLVSSEPQNSPHAFSPTVQPMPITAAACAHCGGKPLLSQLTAQPPSFPASTLAPFQYNHNSPAAFAGGVSQPGPALPLYPSPSFQYPPQHAYTNPHAELMGPPVYPSSGFNEPKRSPAAAATTPSTTGPIVTAVAVGSMLGLTAAAVVEWQ
jgi:hypothetical protein